MPKDSSELLRLLRWNSFMFRHWLALPNISNVIYIPQKRSQTLQVKPNHKPSQSLHLRKMFIFSSCRLRGAQQQIWPAAAHHASAVSTNGRLAAKTLNIALSDLFNVFLIRKEGNTGTCGRPRFGGDSRSSIWGRPGSHSLSCGGDFLVGQLHPCPFLGWAVCLLFCQGSRCLTTAISVQIFHWSPQGPRENEVKHCKNMDGTHAHRPLSLLQLWIQWNTLDALGRSTCPSITCSWRAKRCPSLRGFPLPPVMLKEEVRSKRTREMRSIQRPFPALLGHAMAWGELPCGRARQEGGNGASQWERSRDMRGSKRWGMRESLCSGQGKGMREDNTLRLWSVLFLYS